MFLRKRMAWWTLMALITCAWQSSKWLRKDITFGWLTISILMAGNRLESHFQVRSVLPNPASAASIPFIHPLLRSSTTRRNADTKEHNCLRPSSRGELHFSFMRTATTTCKVHSQLTTRKKCEWQKNITRKEKRETDSFHDVSKSSERHYQLQVINKYKC